MIYNKLLENFILPLGDKALGARFIYHLKKYRKLSRMSYDNLLKIQQYNLKKLLEHSTSYSFFYKEYKNDKDQNPYQWLKKFPVLTKNSLRYDTDKILTVQTKKRLEKLSSSGSTGLPSIVYMNSDELSLARAIQVLWWEWSGYKMGNPLLQTGVSSKRSKVKTVKDFLLRTKYIYAFQHEENEIVKVLRKLQSSPRDHFFGYASSLHLFAKTALKNNIKDIRFKSVVSWAESMPKEFKNTIEEAFHTKVFDTYGASEGLLISAQCKEGNYHITTPHVFVEYLDEDNKEVHEGELGKVIVTSLTNLTTPLIRYEVGDMAYKVSSKTCTCGLGFPVMGKLVGRSNEVLDTPAGKFITVPNIVLIMRGLEEIEEYKLIQKDVNSFVLEVKSVVKIEEDYINKIKAAFHNYLDEKINLHVVQKEKIERSRSGKIQLIRNDFKQ